jgi:hypothetical protein
MVFDSIQDNIGTVLNAVAGFVLGGLEKVAPGAAAWIRGLAGIINISGNEKAIMLLAIAGLAFGFIICLGEIFAFGKLKKT